MTTGVTGAACGAVWRGAWPTPTAMDGLRLLVTAPGACTSTGSDAPGLLSGLTQRGDGFDAVDGGASFCGHQLARPRRRSAGARAEGNDGGGSRRIPFQSAH